MKKIIALAKVLVQPVLAMVRELDKATRKKFHLDLAKALKAKGISVVNADDYTLDLEGVSQKDVVKALNALGWTKSIKASWKRTLVFCKPDDTWPVAISGSSSVSVYVLGSNYVDNKEFGVVIAKVAKSLKLKVDDAPSNGRPFDADAQFILADSKGVYDSQEGLHDATVSALVQQFGGKYKKQHDSLGTIVVDKKTTIKVHSADDAVSLVFTLL